MAVTPNYGWPVPVATDLVKDGYLAISDLGDAIDATVFALPAPASGLTHITTVSLSGASTYDILGCFSATYQNYKIVYTNSAAVGIAIRLNLLAGSTPATGANYTLGINGVAENGSSGNLNQIGQTYMHFCSTAASLPYWSSVDCNVMKPFDARETNFTFTTADCDGALFYGRAGGGLHTLANSYSGIRFVSSGGNFSGTVRIYGYQNS